MITHLYTTEYNRILEPISSFKIYFVIVQKKVWQNSVAIYQSNMCILTFRFRNY